MLMTLLKRSLYLLLLTGALNGCGVFNTFGTANTPSPAVLPPIPASFHATKLWQDNVGIGSDDAYLRLAPAIANGVIYSVDADAKVVATSRTGKTLFTTKLKSTGKSGVGTNGAVVALVDGRAQLFMLDAKTGVVLWHLAAPNQVLAAPTVTADTTYLKTIDGTVAAYRNTDGALLWTYAHGGPPLMLRASSGVVVDGTSLYAAFSDGQAVALDSRSGNLIWEQAVASANGFAEIERMIDIDAKIIIDHGVLFAATYQGKIAALNTHTGAILWQQPLSTYADLALVDNLIIVPAADGSLIAFQRTDGHQVWAQKNLAWRFLTGSAVLDHQLVLGDVEGYLHVVDATSGQYQGRIQPSKNPIYSTPLVDGQQVYSLDSTGKLTAVKFS